MVLLAITVLALVASTHAYDIHRIAAASSGTVQTDVIPKAKFYVPLTGKTPKHAYKKQLLNALRDQGSKPSNYTAVVAGSNQDGEYLTDITIGGQKFKIIVDTGSSDTWLAKNSFKCFNLTSYPEPQSTCGFGTSGFDVSKSKTFVEYPNKNFNISYGDGEFLNGVVGFETVTVGGMTVTKQEISLVTNAAWNGDGVSTGIMGLAYPGLTRVYNGTNPNKDVRNHTEVYNPLFFTAVSEKVVSNPYFSVAINRGSFKNEEQSTYDPNLGYVAFGGIAPVKTSSPTVTVPVQAYSISSNSMVYHYYTVDIDSFIYDGSATLTGSGKHAVLDTGTTLNYLPTEVAKAYNSKFLPPATYDKDSSTYFVDCHATVPEFQVRIGGKQFKIDGKDQILPAGTDSDGNEVCLSGTQDGGDPSDSTTVFILGDVFLHNVVTTFNIQSNQITLTQRASY